MAKALQLSYGVETLGCAVDVASSAAVNAAAQAVLVRFGRIDGLVNNAGIVADAQLKKMTEEQWDRVIGINLKGVYKDRFRALGAKLGIPAFKHQTLRRPETIAWADRQT